MTKEEVLKAIEKLLNDNGFILLPKTDIIGGEIRGSVIIVEKPDAGKLQSNQLDTQE